MSRLSEYQKRLVFEMNAAGTEYLVIGGMAIRAHGIKRETNDLDLIIGPSLQNAQLLNSIFLKRFRFREGHRAADLVRPNVMLREKGVDILSSIDGFNFADAYQRSTWKNLNGCRMRVPSIPDLIAAKRASLASGNDPLAHLRDREDIAILEACLSKGAEKAD